MITPTVWIESFYLSFSFPQGSLYPLSPIFPVSFVTGLTE
jgi:hypothetical protein